MRAILVNAVLGTVGAVILTGLVVTVVAKHAAQKARDRKGSAS
jgi:hypothetical protein